MSKEFPWQPPKRADAARAPRTSVAQHAGAGPVRGRGHSWRPRGPARWVCGNPYGGKRREEGVRAEGSTRRESKEGAAASPYLLPRKQLEVPAVDGLGSVLARHAAARLQHRGLFRKGGSWAGSCGTYRTNSGKESSTYLAGSLNADLEEDIPLGFEWASPAGN